MPNQKTSAIVLFVIIVLLLSIFAYFIPNFINTQNTDITTSLEVNESSSYVVNHPISIYVDNIENGGNDPLANLANVTVIDKTNGNTTTVEVSEDSTQTVTLNNNSITLTLNSVEDTNTAFITVQQPQYIGWPEGTQTFIENLPLIIMLLLILILIGFIFVAFGGN